MKTTQKTTDSLSIEDQENLNNSEKQLRKKTHIKNNELNNKNKFKLQNNTTKELKNNTDSSEIEIVFMIELKHGNKNKIIEFIKKSEKSKEISDESLEAINFTSKKSQKITKSPLISNLVLLKKTSTENEIEKKNLKKQTLKNNETITHNLIITSTSTIITKNIHCFDFSYYCKWWKIHDLCKKPEVITKCNLSCLPECQV